MNVALKEHGSDSILGVKVLIIILPSKFEVLLCFMSEGTYSQISKPLTAQPNSCGEARA
jgi:hypothetical protein